MKALRILFATLVVVLMCAPMAAAQTTGIGKCTAECDPKEANGGAVKKGDDPVKVILYGHFEDILNMAPLNTQRPDDQREPDLNRGFLMPVIDTNALPEAGGQNPNFHFKNNEFTMFSSPGLVEYLQEGWRTHQEPGLANDAIIADSTFNLYWYMSSHAAPQQNSGSGPGATAKIGVVPEVGVYARMETGRFKFRGDEIATSADQAANGPCAPPCGRVNLITTPSGDDVYEFVVKMNRKAPAIPSAETKNGFIVYINPYQIKDKDDQGGVTSDQFMQADWRVRTGPKFPPRVVIPIQDPMSTKANSLTIFEDRLFVRWTFVSDMGSYDMKDSTLQLVNTGAGKIDPKAIDFIILKRSVDHDGHFKPVNATWAIDYTNFPLADGDYQLTGSILNLQETYQLEQNFNFKVVGGKPQVQQIGGGAAGAGGKAGAGGAKAGGKSPGFDVEALAMVGVVAALIAVARRRKA